MGASEQDLWDQQPFSNLHLMRCQKFLLVQREPLVEDSKSSHGLMAGLDNLWLLIGFYSLVSILAAYVVGLSFGGTFFWGSNVNFVKLESGNLLVDDTEEP